MKGILLEASPVRLSDFPFLPFSSYHSHPVNWDESEKRMEEEIICNRWKDLADEPKSFVGSSASGLS
jgi:hypothetical protein